MEEAYYANGYCINWQAYYDYFSVYNVAALYLLDDLYDNLYNAPDCNGNDDSALALYTWDAYDFVLDNEEDGEVDNFLYVYDGYLYGCYNGFSYYWEEGEWYWNWYLNFWGSDTGECRFTYSEA